MNQINKIFPVRYTAMVLCMLLLLIGVAALVMDGSLWWWIAVVVGATLTVVGLRDLRQTRHSILRNYPVIGHMRFFLEFIRPEIRQYFIESETESLPFSRAERSLVYQRAKGEPDNRPFGTLIDVSARGYEWINHSMAPTKLIAEILKMLAW
jgi:glutamate synthase domain-containing protein 2